MLGALLDAPSIPTEMDPEPTPAWLRLTEWTEVVGVNMIMAVNDLRALQVCVVFGCGGWVWWEELMRGKGLGCRHGRRWRV
jgi:hypothetical protein